MQQHQVGIKLILDYVCLYLCTCIVTSEIRSAFIPRDDYAETSTSGWHNNVVVQEYYTLMCSHRH